MWAAEPGVAANTAPGYQDNSSNSSPVIGGQGAKPGAFARFSDLHPVNPGRNLPPAP